MCIENRLRTPAVEQQTRKLMYRTRKLKPADIADLVGRAYRNSTNPLRGYGLYCFNEVVEVSNRRNYTWQMNMFGRLLDRLVAKNPLTLRDYADPQWYQLQRVKKRLDDTTEGAICHVWEMTAQHHYEDEVKGLPAYMAA